MAAEIIQIDTQTFTSQTYEGQDTNLIPTFEVPTNLSENSYIEYFTYDNNQNILTSDYNFTQYTIQNDGQSAGNEGNISQIIVDPEQVLVNNGFDQGEYITYFNFFNKQVGSNLEQLYISEISSDRTEIRLDSTVLSNPDIVEQTTKFISERENSEYFLDFYLNFGDNQLIISNNVVLDNQDPTNPTVLIKLYEPLPEEFDINSTLWVVSLVEEPRAYQVTFEEEPIIFVDTVNISGPNFNLDIKDQVNNSTLELSYIDLITTSLTSSQNQLNSLLEEKEIDINVDYTDFSNFVHFSSAQTRLENFYYKTQLIEQYSSSIAVLNNTVNSPLNVSSSAAVYESKISEIITNFDGYEYFLYYENNPYTWPKTNNQKPYTLEKSDSTIVLSWIGSTNEYSPYYGGLILSASLYDNNNKDNLLFTIPEYLRDDPENNQYELFVQMVAQHYDNIWIYYKEVTQKYNADNRLEYGISKDIVADAIRDFGVKLYQNNFSNDDLYTAFLGITPEGGLFPFPNITGSLPTPPGFEYINTLISASNDYMPLDDVNKSLYKRIYHNLPYLLKSKGTLPGLRALITSYGIPDTILRINEFGGKDKINVNDWDSWQNEFNYAFNTSGSNFISSSWELNPTWNAPNNVPSTLMFRFKTDGLPSNNILYSQSLWYGDGGSALVLKYTGSAYVSESYSGSIIDPYYQYANVIFYPDVNNSTQTASVYLPFYNGGWWSVMVTKNSNTYTLHSQNKIYEGGDNGTLLGFKASSSITYASSAWTNTSTSYFPVSFSISGTIGYDISAYDVGVYDEVGNLAGSFIPFVGAYQEIRYYTVPISESVFIDYTMNPHSVEGNSLNSSPDELAFRASIGGEQYTASISIHPKVTGSWQTTHSFASDSNFYYDTSPNFIPNVEYTFADQPIAGIKNIVNDKIRVENNVLPEGDTLSQYRSLSQQANISQSYTPSINYLEVAFSPQNEINEDIIDQLGYFNIGEFIGDPRLRSSSAESYPALDQLRNEYFTKYVKNYNLKDFIRLIKFFDNSLFKMIRDFVPARTSLASGIVIKQHLLERNKYPQPQMSWENLDISGTLKPTWNGYEPGTVENFEGGTGGSFEPFNLATNVSQSWYETIQTLSGSVNILHNSQDEFYNGEFSGSTILISDGIVNEAYPIENKAFDYKQIYYYGTSSKESSVFEDNFLNPNTSPEDGEILFFSQVKRVKVSLIFINVYTFKYLKIAKTDCNGNNNDVPLSQTKKILVNTPLSTGTFVIEYDVTLIGESGNYYLYEISSAKKQGIFTPYSPFGFPNQVLDYYVSASKTTTDPFSSQPIRVTSWQSESGDVLGYFNPISGIYNLQNTPNTPLIISASFNVSQSGAGSAGTCSISFFDSIANKVSTNLASVTFPSTFTGTKTVSTTYYGVEGENICLSIKGGTNVKLTGSNLLITQSRAVSSSNCESLILEPYISLPNFYNSDENALINSVDGLRDSSYYMDVDYTSGITTPVNFNQLIDGSATRAKVQDSNYTTKRHILPRYEGSRSTSQFLNKWSFNDVGTFGKLPTIENVSSFVAYAPSIGGWPPERMNASAIFIKYLIDQNGDVLIPNTSENSLSITQQNFRSGDKVRITVPSQGSGEVSNLRTIIRGGTRIEPILYTQFGSTPNAQWNTTINFEDIIPSDAGVVGNYTALFKKTNIQFPIPQNGTTLIIFQQSIYGNSYYNTNGYQIPSSAIIDGVNLIFEAQVKIDGDFIGFGTYVVQIFNSTTGKVLGEVSNKNNPAYSSPNFNGIFYVSATLNNSQLQTNDIIKVQLKTSTVNPLTLIQSNSTSFKITQYPAYTTPITSSGVNSIWGYADTTNYPYVITSSNSTLVELYDSNVKQSNISGSGFNPISLPWSIKYGDEFRFEGREDFTFIVGQVFNPAESGSGRLFETGSIEVHFSTNLPVSASSSIFNLDHFLIRRYVDDASQILIEGFKPVNTNGPYIITPEYVTDSLNKNADTFITDLTERGLL